MDINENENKKVKDDIEFKIITLGNPGVGKTSIIQRFVEDDFNANQLSTLGISYSFKVIKIEEKNIRLKLIDTGGQEKYRALAVSYFRHVDVVLFVFDLNNKSSFDSIQYWIDLFNENNNSKNIKGKYLIGNKDDLVQNVDQNLIDELSQNNGIEYLTTSAKTKYQIDALFTIIGGELYEYLKKKKNNKDESNSPKIKVLAKTNVNKKKGCC